MLAVLKRAQKVKKLFFLKLVGQILEKHPINDIRKGRTGKLFESELKKVH